MKQLRSTWNQNLAPPTSPMRAFRCCIPSIWPAGFFGTGFDDIFDVTLHGGQWMQVAGAAGADTFNIDFAGGSIRLNYRHALD